MGKKKKKELVVLTVFNGGEDGAVVATKAHAYKLEKGEALVIYWDGDMDVMNRETGGERDPLSEAMGYDPMEDLKDLTARKEVNHE